MGPILDEITEKGKTAHFFLNNVMMEHFDRESLKDKRGSQLSVAKYESEQEA